MGEGKDCSMAAFSGVSLKLPRIERVLSDSDE